MKAVDYVVKYKCLIPEYFFVIQIQGCINKAAEYLQ
jgi:hypothetical protein